MNRNDGVAQRVRLSGRSVRPVGDPADWGRSKSGV